MEKIEEKIEQRWKIQVVKDNPTFPYLVIDGWYTPKEEKKVWQELDFYTSHEEIDRAENTVVARNKDGSARSLAYRWYTPQYYTDIGYKKSHIFNYMYKQKTPEFHDIIKECMPYARSFMSTNMDTTLISYYEEDDHYLPHHDTFLWTQLTWFVREPRMFDGGDFEFPEPGHTIKLKHNRTVFFPCCYSHQVTPIKFHTKPKEMGHGRYTITHFYYCVPAG